MTDPGKISEETGQNEEAVAKRFGILVCVDGSDESFKALHYAVRIGSGQDADLTLLYVRPVDQGLRSGGLQLSVARKNMLDWGLELPGTKTLKKSRDMLVELGWLDEDWEQEFKSVNVAGDPLGDNVTVYTSDEGRSISMKLLVAPSIGQGILDECALGGYNLTIVPKTDDDGAVGPGFIAPEVADEVAKSHTGTVLVTRVLEESHGHLVCVSEDPGSIEGARRDALIASRCACPVYLFSVAESEAKLPAARKAIDAAKKAIAEVGVMASGEKAVVGDTVTEIVKAGRAYSVIVVTRYKNLTGWRRFFKSSVAFQVLERAHNSVMIRR